MSEVVSMLVAQRAIPNVVRRATWQGRPYLVVRAVLVRSQVLDNNLGSSYLPADEITDEWAEMWNGIPVLIGDHPQQRGENVSGRSPELWDARQVGFIFNAHAEWIGADVRRLTAEVWLDESRADVVQGFRDVLDAVQAGRAVELSTGFRTQPERSRGEFEGKTYELIMRPIGADHLVISTEMTGACSVADGCGLGVHAENCSCGGASPKQTPGAHRHREVGMKVNTTRLGYDMRAGADDYAAPTAWDATHLDGPDSIEQKYPDAQAPDGNPHGDAKIMRRRRATELERLIRGNRKRARGRAPNLAARARWDAEYQELSAELAAIREAERNDRDEYRKF